MDWKPKYKTRNYITPRGKQKHNTVWHYLSNIFLDLFSKEKEIKTKINKWDLFKLKKLLHSKGKHQQNKKTTYWMGENICKLYEQWRVNIQSMKTVHKTQRKRKRIKNG